MPQSRAERVDTRQRQPAAKVVLWAGGHKQVFFAGEIRDSMVFKRLLMQAQMRDVGADFVQGLAPNNAYGTAAYIAGMAAYGLQHGAPARAVAAQQHHSFAWHGVDAHAT